MFKLYLDGKEVASGGGPGMKKMERNSVPVRVGHDGAGGNQFLGEIDRVTIYNRVLSADEIAALAADQGHKSHDLPGRVADWTFADASASEFVSSAPGNLKLRVAGQLARTRLTGEAPPPQDARWILWYRQPAKQWTEAMPLGNGRLGAMVFGGVAEDASSSMKTRCGRARRTITIIRARSSTWRKSAS